MVEPKLGNDFLQAFIVKNKTTTVHFSGRKHSK